VRRSIAPTLLAISTLVTPALAAGEKPSKQQCAAAYVAAQRLRKADKLSEAKAQLEVCADDACPAALTKDCKPWLEDVLQNQPSVKISVIGLDGKPAGDARVTVDGRSVDANAAEPIELDPGKHQFHFELEGANPVDKEIQLSRGDKALPVSADFSGQAPAPSAPESAPAPEPKAETGRPIPVSVWILGGVGLVGLGSFAYFGSKGKSEENHLADTCAPNCDQSDVDASHRKYLIADISLGLSLLAFSGAAYFYFTRPTKERTPTALSITPLQHGGAAAFVSGSF
jgi:hypothetical protein